MAYPKMKPCPKCATDAELAVYTYESGWRHVECIKCNYLGPGEGSIKAAIKSHNGASPDASLPAPIKSGAEIRREERERCADIALAIDSGRGNEKEIAKAIRALDQSALASEL